MDMNLSPNWVPFLQEAGLRRRIGRASDPRRARSRAAHDHVVLTNDLDFSMIWRLRCRHRRVLASSMGPPSGSRIRGG
ncbi:hypothetical protein [Nitrobacter winogradskyi]|uniref:hypothetical protein n=1 Tax=Nitrobacter winogradskyi TaxID=913 RepID=UPI00346025CD